MYNSRLKLSHAKRLDGQLHNIRAVNSSEARRPKAEAGRLREHLGHRNGLCYHLIVQICSMKDTLNQNESELSAHATEFYCPIDQQRQFSSTNYEGGSRKRGALIIVAGSSFTNVEITRTIITFSHLFSVVCSCSPFESLGKFIWFSAPLAIKLDILIFLQHPTLLSR